MPTRKEFILGSLAAPLLLAGTRSIAAEPIPRTLLDLEQQQLKSAGVAKSALVVIDAQNEYRHGPLALDGIELAIRQLATLLGRARAAGTPIVHIAQIGAPGDLFDRKGERGQFIAEVAPHPGETIIEKPLPNSFTRTGLNDHLTALGRKDIIVCGFMTHMCVSSTVRAGFDLDYRITVAADATATRALPGARRPTRPVRGAAALSRPCREARQGVDLPPDRIEANIGLCQRMANVVEPQAHAVELIAPARFEIR